MGQFAHLPVVKGLFRASVMKFCSNLLKNKDAETQPVFKTFLSGYFLK